MVGMQSSNIGNSIGFMLPSLLVPTTLNIPILRKSIENMLNYIWIFQAIHFVLLLVFFKEKASSTVEPEEQELLEPEQDQISEKQEFSLKQ